MAGLRIGLPVSLYKSFQASDPPDFGADEGMMASFNANDKTAYTTVYNKLYQPVFYFARRFVSPEVAEDICADVFCKLWTMQKNFTRLQHIKVFLQVSVRNACLSYLEHEGVVDRHRKMMVLTTDEKMEDLFYEDEIRAHYIKRIVSAIEALPPRQKKIFKLSYLSGLREQEIADLLRLGKTTVHTHRMRAIKNLRLAVLVLKLFLPFLFFHAS